MNGRPWSPEEDAIMRQLYPNTLTEAIGRQLGRSVTSTYSRAHKLGLAKSKAFLIAQNRALGLRLATAGKGRRFAKGHVPANKGLRRLGWGPGRMKQTQFKKGDRQGRALEVYKPIGTERLSKDGYLERKVNNDMPFQRRWRAVHLLVWEAANGPLPKGHAVSFINRDKTDIRIENLQLISRADLARRNSVHNLPPELKKTIHALGQLKRRAREKQDRRSA